MALLAAMMLLAMPAGAVEVRGVPYDQSSVKYNNTLSWDAETFPGFWYAFPVGKSSEALTIQQQASSLTAGRREIRQKNLIYETRRSEQKYRVFLDEGKKLENGESFYYRLGWFGELHVAVNGKANKLAKLVKEQKKEEKQTLKFGESWNLGEGYNLTVEAIDAKASPRQAWLGLSKDGKRLDNKVVSEGEVYTYIQENLGGESNVPVFVTYIETVFSGTPEIVQFRRTWLISQNVTEVKPGDQFGVFEVREANENHLLLTNEKAVNLDQNTVVDLAGGIRFRVADSATVLRFYPFVDKKDPAPQTQTIVSAPVVVSTANFNSSAIQANLNGAPLPQSPSIAEQASMPAPQETAVTPPKAKTNSIGLIWVIALLVLAVVGYFMYPYINKQNKQEETESS